MSSVQEGVLRRQYDPKAEFDPVDVHNALREVSDLLGTLATSARLDPGVPMPLPELFKTMVADLKESTRVGKVTWETVCLSGDYQVKLPEGSVRIERWRLNQKSFIFSIRNPRDGLEKLIQHTGGTIPTTRSWRSCGMLRAHKHSALFETITGLMRRLQQLREPTQGADE